MSHHATPFIVVNLGCEMVFVIEQRLKAQNISLDKSERVLTDIVTVLLHPKLLDELFISQPVAKHSVVKQLLQDISTTSIMKLDDYSMSKLWDLMTMIFKWQLYISRNHSNQNIFNISRRHLKNVAMIMPHYFPKISFEQTMKRFENLSQQCTDADYVSLSNTIIDWFSHYYTKISVLIRLGLQGKDGTFSTPATINPKIVNNLGENIYQYDSKKNSEEDYDSLCLNTREINCLLSSIEQVVIGSRVKLHLPVNLENDDLKKKTLEIERDIPFENISINVKTKYVDLSFNPDIPKSPQDDLLQMLDNVVE